jgi:hypothetical protein
MDAAVDAGKVRANDTSAASIAASTVLSYPMPKLQRRSADDVSRFRAQQAETGPAERCTR